MEMKFLLSEVGGHARVMEGEVQHEGDRLGGVPDGRHALVVPLRTTGRQSILRGFSFSQYLWSHPTQRAELAELYVDLQVGFSGGTRISLANSIGGGGEERETDGIVLISSSMFSVLVFYFSAGGVDAPLFWKLWVS